MKKRMLLPYTVITVLLMISCGNSNQEPKEEIPVEPIVEQPRKPTYEPSRYSSQGDTVFINDLQIILDSVSVRTTANKVGYLQGQQKMLSVYVSMTNIGKETKEIPFVDQIEEQRKRTDISTARIRLQNNPDDLDLRIGSRIFLDKKTKSVIIEIKPKQTVKGYYSIKYESRKFSALSFWYFTDEMESDDPKVAMIEKVSKKQTVKGKNTFQILTKDVKVNDVGFDITDLINQKSQE